MIDIEQLWKTDSEVANFRAVISAFYDMACNAETPPIDELRKLDDKKIFAYNCKCGNGHIHSRHLWNEMFLNLIKKTPDENHPEYAEYASLLKSFPKELDRTSVRDYAEPYLRATEEGKYIEAADKEVEEAITSLIAALCSSPLTAKSRKTSEVGNALAAYKCPIHKTTHYISSIDNKKYRHRLVSTPAEILQHLSPLSVRIVLRDMDARRREFNDKFPTITISLPAHKQKSKAENVTSFPLTPKTKPSAEKKAEVSVVKPKVQTSSVVDKNLYILAPNLMSEEWLIEYQVCGRKTPMTREQAVQQAKLHPRRMKKAPYFCMYGSHWHIGTVSSKNKSPLQVAVQGLHWYKKDPKRANRFIHRIMMEEF